MKRGIETIEDDVNNRCNITNSCGILQMDCSCDHVSDVICNYHPSLHFDKLRKKKSRQLNMLSLFSGCGGMDIGFEGGFICHKKSINPDSGWIDKVISDNWVRVKETRFHTIFANDILEEARNCWCSYMLQHGHDVNEYHFGSIVDIVKGHLAGHSTLPTDVDIVTGGFPCQDFSVAGKRKGFDSNKDHTGRIRTTDAPSEETRGKLYYWMKQVIDIVRPKIFVAENVKGLVNLGDVKEIIQHDFMSADNNGYIVLQPQVLHAADYGVPESRERVIFIGIRRDALKPEALDALSRNIVPQDFNPYPAPTHCFTNQLNLMQPVVCQDVFEDLKEPGDTSDLSQMFYSGAKYMGSHCQGQTEVLLNKIGPTIRSEHHGNIEFRRLSKEHGGANIEELENGLPERRLTPRECALIQTFPPDYKFVRYKGYKAGRFLVSPTGAYKVIGNAVPPVLAYNIAMRLQELWDKYFY